VEHEIRSPTAAERAAAFRALLLERTLERQDGVVSRRQLLEVGFSPSDIRRLLRRRELVRLHPRVYVNHTGPPTWRQRARAALLYATPAALCHESVLEPARDDGAAIHVAIERTRRVDPQPGIVVHRLTGLASHTFSRSDPLRLRLEDNALLVAGGAPDHLAVVAALTAVVGRRGVTVASLRAAVGRFPRLRHRRLVLRLLDDLASGASSVLEHEYLVRVERAHGLPTPRRQSPRRTPDGREFRDVEYSAYGVVIELDGRLGHDSWAGQGTDADRALDDLAGATESVTARLRWRQVFETPCRTAARIGRILQRRGWTVEIRSCGPGCEAVSGETVEG